MARVKNQDMFEHEECPQCTKLSELYTTLRGKYMHRCPACSCCWVTPGSHMQLMNKLMGSKVENRIGITISDDEDDEVI